MQDKIQKYGVLSSSVVGVEFEMYSYKSPSEIAKTLGRALNKKITVSKASGKIKKSDIVDYDELANKLVSKGPSEETYKHKESVIGIFTPSTEDNSKKTKKSTGLKPTSSNFVLKRDYSGGRDMNEIVTGPLPYEEARLVIIKVLDWIRNNGWTDAKCSIHLNISFNPVLSGLKTDVMHIEPLKLVLSYDEKYVYDRFPDRKYNVYARSIYQVFPVNKFVYQSTAENLDPANFIVPDEKYYGINFTKRVLNYLEVRYVGGKDYEKKTAKILEVLDYSILKIYDALLNPSIDALESAKLRSMVVDMKKVIETFSSPQKFFINYPKMTVLVDMKGSIEIIKSYWTTIREQLYSLIIMAGAKEGIFNYDTDLGKAQLKNSVLRNAHELRNFELFDCDFTGSAYDTLFFRCKILNSRLNNCSLIEAVDADNTMLEDTNALSNSVLTNCYINCPDDIIDCKITGGVIRNAILGIHAEVSDDTLTIN